MGKREREEKLENGRRLRREREREREKERERERTDGVRFLFF